MRLHRLDASENHLAEGNQFSTDEKKALPKQDLS